MILNRQAADKRHHMTSSNNQEKFSSYQFQNNKNTVEIERDLEQEIELDDQQDFVVEYNFDSDVSSFSENDDWASKGKGRSLGKIQDYESGDQYYDQDLEKEKFIQMKESKYQQESEHYFQEENRYKYEQIKYYEQDQSRKQDKKYEYYEQQEQYQQYKPQQQEEHYEEPTILDSKKQEHLFRFISSQLFVDSSAQALAQLAAWKSNRPIETINEEQQQPTILDEIINNEEKTQNKLSIKMVQSLNVPEQFSKLQTVTSSQTYNEPSVKMISSLQIVVESPIDIREYQEMYDQPPVNLVTSAEILKQKIHKMRLSTQTTNSDKPVLKMITSLEVPNQTVPQNMISSKLSKSPSEISEILSSSEQNIDRTVSETFKQNVPTKMTTSAMLLSYSQQTFSEKYHKQLTSTNAFKKHSSYLPTETLSKSQKQKCPLLKSGHTGITKEQAEMKKRLNLIHHERMQLTRQFQDLNNEQVQILCQMDPSFVKLQTAQESLESHKHLLVKSILKLTQIKQNMEQQVRLIYIVKRDEQDKLEALQNHYDSELRRFNQQAEKLAELKLESQRQYQEKQEKAQEIHFEIQYLQYQLKLLQSKQQEIQFSQICKQIESCKDIGGLKLVAAKDTMKKAMEIQRRMNQYYQQMPGMHTSMRI